MVEDTVTTGAVQTTVGAVHYASIGPHVCSAASKLAASLQRCLAPCKFAALQMFGTP
jgi:hypothetical protein